METFRVKVAPGEGICTLILSGEGDLAVAPDIVELGTISLAEPTTLTLIVDLAAVTFIDSTCIGALIQLHNLAEAASKQLLLANVPDRVHQILTITGLDKLFADPAGRSTSDRPPDPDSLEIEREPLSA